MTISILKYCRCSLVETLVALEISADKLSYFSGRESYYILIKDYKNIFVFGITCSIKCRPIQNDQEFKEKKVCFDLKIIQPYNWI